MDGALFNFVIPTETSARPAARPEVLPKGNWKQKRLALKRQRGQQVENKSARTSLAPPTDTKVESKSGITSDSRLPLAQKTDSEEKDRPAIAERVTTPTSAPSKAQQPESRPPDAATGFVSSSIFTSNPDIPQIASIDFPPINRAPNVFSANSFEDMQLDPLLLKHLSTKLGIEKPTKIQKYALPALLDSSRETDFLVKAQTGSGKTLAFVLPMIQRILNASNEVGPQLSESQFSRKLGALAIILTPTRELARQIYSNVESVLSYSNTTDRVSETSADEETTSNGQTFKRHWIVPGIVVGGEKKKSEKARLRKGINILVSTPGRLLDHLKTTQCFEAGNLRWLVLDEADRLLELGFEETLTEILKILDDKLRMTNSTENSINRLQVASWPKGRQTILCSATLSDQIKKLASTRLKNPVMINEDKIKDKKKKPVAVEKLPVEKEIAPESVSKKQNVVTSEIENVIDDDVTHVEVEDSMQIDTVEAEEIAEKGSSNLTIPPQIHQSYVIAPAKQRLVLLVSLLRHLAIDWKTVKENPESCKIIVFMSSCDAVDFYYRLFLEGASKSRFSKEEEVPAANYEWNDSVSSDNDEEIKATDKISAKGKEEKPAVELRPVIPFLQIQKLHGNLPMKNRSATTKEFRASKSAILFCTDVAARGLDVPDVTHVVQFDPPTDISDYAHRVGRTARIGKKGDSTIFLLPSETEFLEVLRKKNVENLMPINSEKIMRYLINDIEEHEENSEGTSPNSGIDGVVELTKQVMVNGKKVVKRKHYEVVATDLHMMLERYVLGKKDLQELARSAFTAHVRAYATHSPTHEFFHVKRLHLGHIAKAFALREAPNNVAHANSKATEKKRRAAEKEEKSRSGFSSFKRRSDALLGASANEFSDGNVRKLIKIAPKKKN